MGLYPDVSWLANEVEHTGVIDVMKQNLVNMKLTVI